MKYVHSDELDTLADSISDNLLHECLDALNRQHTWRLSSNATFENVSDFYSWIQSGYFSPMKGNGIICCIFKIQDFARTIYSTFVLVDHCRPPSQLASELRRVINLKVFL